MDNNPLALVRVLGCAAWIHQVHPTGHHVDKMNAKSALHVYAGVSEKNQCFKFRRLLDCHVSYSAHAIFNEEEFPFRHTSELAKEERLVSKLIVPVKKSGVVQAPERKRVTWPDLKSILKAHSTTTGLSLTHSNSLAFMLDSKEICYALTLISTIGGAPRSIKRPYKGQRAMNDSSS